MDKNKLAEEYARSITGQFSSKNDWNIADNFLAGFDASESIANAKIQELEQQLKRADEVMRSMHIDTMAWNIKTTDKEVLSGWHESNNEAIEKYLKSRGE